MKNWLRVLTVPLDDLTFVQRFMLRGFLFFLAPLIKIENEAGIPPAKSPVIFAFNHNCSYETLLIVLYLVYKRQGKKVNFIVDWMYGYAPIVGWFIRQTDPIFTYGKPARSKYFKRLKSTVKQKNVYLECFENLKKDHSIGIFPEGTRNRNPYELKKGHHGIAKIALKTGVPILPIGVDFPNRIKKGKIPKFGSLILRVGDKLTVAKERAAVRKIIQQDEFAPVVKSELLDYFEEKVTYDVMQELSKLSGKNYPFNPPGIPYKAASYLKKLLKTGELI